MKRRWTSDHVAELLRRIGRGERTPQIALALGRSEFSIHLKIARLRAAGVDVPKRRKGPPPGYRHDAHMRLYMSTLAAERLAERHGIRVDQVGDYRLFTRSKGLTHDEAISVLRGAH